MERCLQGVLLSRLLLSGIFKVLRVNKDDTANWTLPTNETAICIWVSCITLKAVNERKGKQRVGSIFRALAPKWFNPVFFGLWKVGLQVICGGSIKPEESPHVCCCHTRRQACRGTPLLWLLTELGSCHLGAFWISHQREALSRKWTILP